MTHPWYQHRLSDGLQVDEAQPGNFYVVGHGGQPSLGGHAAAAFASGRAAVPLTRRARPLPLKTRPGQSFPACPAGSRYVDDGHGYIDAARGCVGGTTTLLIDHPPLPSPPPPPPPPTDDAAPGVYAKLRTIAQGKEGDMKQYALWAASGVAIAALLYGARRMAQR
jgi:hypothetical protein